MLSCLTTGYVLRITRREGNSKMKHLRNGRRLAALGALAAMVGVTLWFVIPAFGASGKGLPGGPTDGGVQPTYELTGGQPNDCALFGSPASDQYLIKNPSSVSGQAVTLTSTSGAHVTIKLTVQSDGVHFDFTVTGGTVFDVGVDGGSGTDRYKYSSNLALAESGDTSLHAPLQPNGHSLSSLSQTTFCYSPNAPVQCEAGFFGPNPDYQIQFSDCGAKGSTNFFFGSGTVDNKPFVSVWSDGSSGTLTPMIEQITFDDPLDGNGQPTFTGLLYDDSFPFTGPYNPMPYCKLDPRQSGMNTLEPPYDTSTTDVLPGSATSCVIAITTTADTSSNSTFEAYVYSAIDGGRLPT
jgi:hypothetical protein